MSRVSSVGRVAPAHRIYNQLLTIAISALLVFGGAVTSHAVIVKPIGVTAVSAPGTGVQYQSSSKIINGSGLSTPLNTGDPVPLTGFWPTHSSAQSDLWVADDNVGGPLTWTVTFTLGGTYSLSGFHLWNESEGEFGRSAKNYTASYSTDDISYSPITTSPAPFLPGSGSGLYQGDNYDFASYVTASYVRFTITSDYGGGFVGLSEIRFVPEPTSLSFLGLGVVGLLRRRRAGC